MSAALLSPKTLPDRGWRFVLRGGIAIEHYTGRIEASGYLFQERRIASVVLGVPDPRVVVRSCIVSLSGTVDHKIMEAARNKDHWVTAQIPTVGMPIQLWRSWRDPLSGYGLWVGVALNLWCAGELVGEDAIISEVIPLRGTDWDGPKPSL